MIEKLIKIYNNKIILKVEKFDYSKYYYFYMNNEKDDIFGIEKTISDNEYQLIKSSYIEKKIYNNNNALQHIYEYLFENKTYPFKNKKVKLLLIESEYTEFKELLLSFYKEVELIVIDNLYVAFCYESYNDDICSFVSTLSDDLGITFKLHEGMKLSNKIEGIVVRKYTFLQNVPAFFVKIEETLRTEVVF